MKKIVLAAILALGISAPAYAMTYFLRSQWSSPQGHFCQYSNGTVLNMTASPCPLSIEG